MWVATAQNNSDIIRNRVATIEIKYQTYLKFQQNCLTPTWRCHMYDLFSILVMTFIPPSKYEPINHFNILSKHLSPKFIKKVVGNLYRSNHLSDKNDDLCTANSIANVLTVITHRISVALDITSAWRKLDISKSFYSLYHSGICYTNPQSWKRLLG